MRMPSSPSRSRRHALLVVLFAAGTLLRTVAAPAEAGSFLLGERELQRALDETPAHATLVCDPNRVLTLSKPVEIRRPLTLRGLAAQLPPKLGNTSLLVIRAPGVALLDLTLTGNGDSVPQSERAPLVVVAAGDFRIERVRFFNCSKDGINVDGDAAGADIVGGVIRDITGHHVIRDTVSISGGDKLGFKIRNVLVDNVRAYDSSKRGAVEVSDGSENITVRKVYAERCIYAVDVQDHSKPAQINRNIVVEDIYATHSKHAIRTSNHALGHAGLTVRDITAEHCTDPIQISNTTELLLENARVLDHAGAASPIAVKNCPNAIVRDVTVARSTHNGAAVAFDNCDNLVVDGVSVRDSPQLGAGVRYRLTQGGAFSGLRIAHVRVPVANEAGIVLETTGEKKSTLSDYLVHANLATVDDRIRGERGVIEAGAR